MQEFLVDSLKDRGADIVGAKSPLEVLVVDDDTSVLSALRRCLSSVDGVHVFAAHSAADARIKARALRPRVMLLDFDLGDATALELLADLSSSRVLEQTRVVVMSGRPHEHERDQLHEYGVSSILVKPLHLAALCQDFATLASGSDAGLHYIR